MVQDIVAIGKIDSAATTDHGEVGDKFLLLLVDTGVHCLSVRRLQVHGQQYLNNRICKWAAGLGILNLDAQFGGDYRVPETGNQHQAGLLSNRSITEQKNSYCCLIIVHL